MSRTLCSTLLAGIAAALAGCVTVDGTLKGDGSGTVEVTYHVMPNTSEALEKHRFTAPHVTLQSLALHEDGTATAKLAFDDPAKLSAVELFRSAAISRRREGDEERLLITITNEVKADVKDETKPGPRITITLPGPVLEANRNATIDGNKLTWRFGLAEFVREKTVELSARYRVPASADHP